MNWNIWRDDWFSRLESKQKLLLIYVWSCSVFPAIRAIAFETGLDQDFITETLKKFDNEARLPDFSEYSSNPTKSMMERRSRIWATTRRSVTDKILKRDANLCRYCGETAGHIDHVIPKIQGGTDEINNLVAACQSCNSAKGGRTPEQAGMSLLPEYY